MENFNFDELTKGSIYNKLIYPQEILSTIQDAERILEMSPYLFFNQRKKTWFIQYRFCGVIFFDKNELLKFKGGTYAASTFLKGNQHEDHNFDDLESMVYNKLFYPVDKLLTRKTAPAFLKMSVSAFDRLRKRGAFFEYEYLGVKFFDKEELAEWDPKSNTAFTAFRRQYIEAKLLRIAV
jgi:hypothetical protein